MGPYYLGMIAIIALAAWDATRRLYNAQRDARQFERKLTLDLTKDLQILRDDFTVEVEKQRAALQTFLESLTAIVKLSEEEKQALKNKLAADKFRGK